MQLAILFHITSVVFADSICGRGWAGGNFSADDLVIGSSEVCSADVTNTESEEQDASGQQVTFLQTALSIGGSALANISAGKGSTDSMLVVSRSSATSQTVKLFQTNSTGCWMPIMPVGWQVGMETLRAVGQMPKRNGKLCEHWYSLKKSPTGMSKEPTAVALLAEPNPEDRSLIDTIFEAPLVVYMLAVYFFAYLVVISSMLRTVYAKPSTVNIDKGDKLPARPELEAWKRGLFSWLTISWATPWVIRWGNAEDTDSTKIRSPELGETGDPADHAMVAVEDFWQVWKDDVKTKGEDGTNLYAVIFKFCTWKKVLLAACSTAGSEFLKYLGPSISIEWTLNYLAWLEQERMVNPDFLSFHETLYPASMVILLFTGLPMLMALFNTTTFLVNMRLNIRLQGALNAAVYQKAQRLPVGSTSWELQEVEKSSPPSSSTSTATTAAPSSSSSDEEAKDNTQKEDNSKDEKDKVPDSAKYNLVWLVNSDIGSYLIDLQTNIARCTILIPILFVLLFMVASRMKKATWITVFVSATACFLIYQTARQFIIRLRWAQCLSSTRMEFFQEVMFGIRVVKSYAWEEAAFKHLENMRNSQLEQLKWYFMWIGAVFGLVISFPRIMIVSSLTGYVWSYDDLTASNIFVIIQVLNAFKSTSQELMSIVPQVIALGPSIRRLDLFLKLKEANIPGPKVECKQPWISVWEPERPLIHSAPKLRVQGSFSWKVDGKVALDNIDISINKGELVAIVGEVASGKTTLLNAMLGELAPLGDARVELPQKMAYHAQVPHICEGTLKENVLYYSDYDETRYHDAIFSASLENDLKILPGGDAVSIGGRGIFLSGGQRARVSLARCAYTADADALLLDDPFASVDVPTGSHLFNHLLMGPLMRDRTRVVVCQPDLERMKQFDRVIIVSNGRIVVQGAPSEVMQTNEYRLLLSSQTLPSVHTTNGTNGTNGNGTTARPSSVDTKDSTKDKVRALRDDENEGRASWNSVWYFLKLGNCSYFVLSIGLYLLNVCCFLLSDMVLASWSNNMIYEQGDTSSWVYVRGYFFWLVMSIVIYNLSWYLGSAWSLNVSATLHGTIVQRLLRAPIDRFYDRTPVGRMLNRMSKDLGTIDYTLYNALQGAIGLVIWFCLPIAYIHFVMPLLFTFLALPFHLLAYTLVRRYWNTIVPLRYLVATERSEVNNYISEVEGATSTVRAYQVAGSQSKRHMLAVGNMMKADFVSAIIRRWVLNRLLVLLSFLCTTVALMAIYFPDTINVGTAALCLTNVIAMIMTVESYLDAATAAQHEMIAMERLHEYTEIVQEAPDVMPIDRRYQSFTVVVQRSSLRGLESWPDGKGRLQTVRLAPFNNGYCQPCRMCVGRAHPDSEEKEYFVVLQEGAGRKGFVAIEGETLQALDPANPQLKDLEAWHQVVAVNSAVGDPHRIAEELCYGHSETVNITIQSGWLNEGAKVEICDLTAGYADIPIDVIKGVNLTIERKCKVAIAGTTGCGKSTMLLCLLRILEPRTGCIKIEGVNTQHIGLRTLRRTIGLVPQDPVIFTGTIRSNLDPFNEYTDGRIWQALHSVQLATMVAQAGLGLYMAVQAEGENLSFGQRQLLCIARMILRQPQLLLLDEATSSIVPATQEVIQKSIRECFPDSTIIAIAHRLETIMDFDMVVVMQRGTVVEKGSVQELSQLSGGVFAHMLKAGH